MTRTDDIDRLIADTLTAEEREFLAELEEPSMMQQGLDLFRSRHRALTLGGAVAMLAFLAFAIYCGARFVGATDVSEMLRWGAGGFLAVLLIFAIKIWSWMQIQSNALRRELKRLELQLASLAGRQRAGGRG